MDLDVPALFDMANMKMPYGKFKGWALIDLPEPYVIWINNNNLPQGKLGQLLKLLLLHLAEGNAPRKPHHQELSKTLPTL